MEQKEIALKKIALIFYTSGAGGPVADKGQLTGESVANLFLLYQQQFIQLLEDSNVDYRRTQLTPAEVENGKYKNAEALEQDSTEDYDRSKFMPGTGGLINRENLLSNLQQHIEKVTINTLYGYETFTIGGDHSFGGADILAKIFAGVLTELREGRLVSDSDKESSQYIEFTNYLENQNVNTCDYKEVLRLYKAMYEDDVINKEELSAFTKTFGVLWADAHADINNDFESTPRDPHGMPLSFAIGDMADKKFKHLIHSSIVLDPKNIFHVFGRDFDPYVVLSKPGLSEEEKNYILDQIPENERNKDIFREDERFDINAIPTDQPSITIGANYAIFESELSRLERIGARYVLANGKNNIGAKEPNKLATNAIVNATSLADEVKKALKDLKVITAIDLDALNSPFCFSSSTPVGPLSPRNQNPGPGLSFFTEFLQKLRDGLDIVGGHIAEVVMEQDKFLKGIPVVLSSDGTLQITTANNPEGESHVIPTDTGANQLSVLATFAILAQVMSLTITEALSTELISKDLSRRT